MCWCVCGMGVEKEGLFSGECVKFYSCVIKEKIYFVEFFWYVVEKMSKGICEI